MNPEIKATFKSFHRVLDTNGDGTGTSNVLTDQTSADLLLYADIPSTERYIITTIKIMVESTTAMAPGLYGDNAALSGGIELFTAVSPYTTVQSRVVDFTMCCSIKTNSDLYVYANGDMPNDWTNIISINPDWHGEDWGLEIGADGASGTRFYAKMRGDFTGLVRNQIYIAGYIPNKMRFYWI